MAGLRMSPQQYRDHLVKQGKISDTVPDSIAARLRAGTPGEAKFWPIVPVPAPRQSQRDKFAPAKRVQRYRSFAADVRMLEVWHPTPGDRVVFYMPIPKSRVKQKLAGQPHTQIPDVDNLLKALLDACYADDSHIWAVEALKLWHPTGGIYIERRAPSVWTPFLPDVAKPAAV